jgi:hypothetical protein
VVRRKLITWSRANGQKALNEVMEGAIRVAAGTGIRVQHEKKESLAHFVRKWAFIDGQRSVGRFTVVSSANQASYQGTFILALSSFAVFFLLLDYHSLLLGSFWSVSPSRPYN